MVQVAQKVVAVSGDVAEQVRLATVRHFGENEWSAMQTLVQKESGFNQYARNPSSGACGLYQALPCSKLPCNLDDVNCQAEWGIGYIKGRYGTPSNALAFHYSNGWY